jgi:anti-anti-sigma factor
MNIMESSLDGVPLLTIVGEADQAVGPQLAMAAQRATSSRGPHVLLDLELCPYLDSGALNVVFDLVQRAEPGGWVGVVHCHPMVLRLLSLVGLTACDSFRIFRSFDEAAAAVAVV